MNKWAIGIATAALLGCGSMASIFINKWVDRVNADHETLTQLVFKDRYLNGPVPAAPVTAPKQ